MPSTHDLRPIPLAQAVELFKAEFRRRYLESEFAVDGAGYDDEDVDLDIYADGNQIELEQYAVEVSHAVQSATATSFFLSSGPLPISARPSATTHLRPAGAGAANLSR